MTQCSCTTPIMIKYTVDVRNPDVRFLALFTFVRLPNMSGFRYPDFKRLVDSRYNVRISNAQIKRSKSGHLCPVIGRSVFEMLSKIRTFGKLRFGHSKSGLSITGHKNVRFGKPDVRYSALHCMYS